MLRGEAVLAENQRPGHQRKKTIRCANNVLRSKGYLLGTSAVLYIDLIGNT